MYFLKYLLKLFYKVCINFFGKLLNTKIQLQNIKILILYKCLQDLVDLLDL